MIITISSSRYTNKPFCPSSCTKKCASWSASIRSQLDLDHQLLFPAVLTYRLSCDRKALAQMKGRTLGNSASRLHSFLVEQHTAEWMRRSIHYLNTCRKFEVAGVQMPPPQPPPQMVTVPSSGWLLSTYVLESFTRIEELKAKVTSIFGSISVIEHLSLLGLTFCRATSGMTLDQWLKVNVPKTTGWRLQIKMASAAAGVFPTRRDRTCTLCSQRTTRATGHSMHRPTRQSFCQVSDPQNRTVEQWLTELRGGKTEKEMLRDRQRVSRKKKKKKAAILNKKSS
ncbi:uncharacterized protein LOC117558207 [Gymnodraco acuticeps]|uniref:Uncharacterized protein LOC117558207 n=1 Tax=Gymnodraco acuticeps TaxID=8218 RepID=A0A6P8WRH5_GYMAC|nr:uncharacterized protein LOC117558207 [Gymnodraco acuticeps]